MNKAFHIGMSVVVALLLSLVIVRPSIADSAILLEEQRQNYWNYLATARTEYGEVLRSTAEIENRRNFIVNSLGVIEGDGYILKANEDGTISFTGKNNGGDASYLFCTLDVLPDGEYVYDDGVEIPGITSYVEGVNYLIGGGEERERFSRVFAHEYSRYECRVEIAAGFEGDVVIYPMLKIATDTDESYEPCLTKGIEVSDPVGYNMVWVNRDALNSIDIDDLYYFYRNLKGTRKNVGFVTFCLGDNTGLLVELDEPVKCFYGTINFLGMVIDRAEWLTESELLEYQKQFAISDITDFMAYIDELKRGQYSFIVSIKDEGTSGLTEYGREKLAEAGFNTSFGWKYRNSFIAVFDEGRNIFEKIDENKLTYDASLSDGTAYSIISEGLLSGNLASIQINGQEYAMNRRGMNFVVIENGKVIDTVAFDTCSNRAAYRQRIGIN